MTARCAHRARRRASCERGEDLQPSSAPVPIGRFVQVMAGELARFASDHKLGFDDRALLEHLLLAADHRSGVITPFSATELARQLGLGPSGRRTLTGRLDRLAEAGALTWSGGSDGRLQILIYRRLVHAGTVDARRGFVQLVPAALAAHVRQHSLSATAAALLTRLCLVVDPRSQRLATTVVDLADAVGLGWRRLRPALEQLCVSGTIRWCPGHPLELVAYSALIRPSTSPATAGARQARDRASSQQDRAPQPAEARGGAGSFSRVRDQDTPPAPRTPPAGEKPSGRGWGLLAEIETTLSEPQRQALGNQQDRGRLAQLGAELDRLLAGGWEPQALLSHVGAPLPETWRSPARLLWARAHALSTVPPDPEAVRAEADATRLAAQLDAARNYARNHAAVEFLSAGEIAASLAEAYAGAALEAGLAVLVACRPEEHVGHPSGAPPANDVHSEAADGVPVHTRSRRDPSSPGPTALGDLLLSVPWERQAS